ncbi:MAG: hypothetical protein ACRCX2_34300 [Paraclostridium sp.]
MLRTLDDIKQLSTTGKKFNIQFLQPVNKILQKASMNNISAFSSGESMGEATGVGGGTIEAVKYSNPFGPKATKALLNGDGYLEFDIEMIDSSTPTANGLHYTKEIMNDAIGALNVQRAMRAGGIPCEVNHHYDRDNIKRYGHTDMNNISHYITKLYWVEDKLWCTIRTSIKNRIIVENIINGMMPSFSIRGTIQGAYDNAGNVIIKAYNFVSIDYVNIPANDNSWTVINRDNCKLISTYGDVLTAAESLEPTKKELLLSAGESFNIPEFTESNTYTINLASGESMLVSIEEDKSHYNVSDCISGAYASLFR